MSPILLGHANLKWILLALGVLIFIIFWGGYILGFEKSNAKWMANLDPVKIALPNAKISTLEVIEAYVPEFEEPGARIDVDSADNHDVVVAKKSDAYTGSAENTVTKETLKQGVEQDKKELAREKETVEVVAKVPAVEENSEERPVWLNNIATINATNQALSVILTGIDGTSQNETEIKALSKSASKALTILDDATEKTARYSVQVGMYSSFENANAKVAQLLNANLTAYLDDFKNKNDETRYSVRFGYFSSFKRGLKALSIYEKNFDGSAYVARIER